MKAKTVLILGAAALYFYGPRLVSRVADEAGEALENLTETAQSGRAKSRRPKALSQPEQAEGFENNTLGSDNSIGSNNALISVETEGETFEERAATAHMSRRAGKTGMRSGTDGL